MVKFGRHLQFLRQDQRTPAYLVEYKKVSTLLGQEDAFTAAWREGLQTATAEYSGLTAALWQRVIDGVSRRAQAEDADELRGARPLAALRAYHALFGVDEARKLIDEFGDSRNAAVANSEALRKLVKKYDKELTKTADQDRARLSATLLPELYSSALAAAVDADHASPFLVLRAELQIAATGAAATVTSDGGTAHSADEPLLDHQDEPLSVTVMRKASVLPGAAMLAGVLSRWAPVIPGAAGLEEMAGEQMNKVRDWSALAKTRASMKQRVEEAMVGRRAEEVAWLRSLTWPSNVVAHRGFHSPSDLDRRPIENSLEAYEMAWTAGVKLCECDVAVTSDGFIVLGHDADYERLAMKIPGQQHRSVKVGDLTLSQLMSMPLKSGSRPPLLTEVLRSASHIGGGVKLVIEIKPGNSAAVAALTNLFSTSPQMLQQVAVVMSFDAFIMHEFAARLRELDQGLHMGAISGEHSVKDEAQALARKPTFKMAGQATIASARIRRATPSLASSTQRVASVTTLEPSARFFGGHLPKLMLLTVADRPSHPVELWLDIMTDTSKVQRNAVGLDGLYIEFQPQMLEPEGKAMLTKLTGAVGAVGVWGRAKAADGGPGDPDDLHTLQLLVGEGVTFVNSDLPRSFLEGRGAAPSVAE